MKPFYSKMSRMLFLTVLAALVLMLTGSGDPNRPQNKPYSLKHTAAALGNDLPQEDRVAWERAARINPLWLIEATTR